MPLFTCPNGHRWEAPSGEQPLPEGSGVSCPVCGVPTEVRPPPGDATPPPGPRGPGDLPPPAPSDVPPRPPDYEILEEVGRGGMGIVYKARQVSRDRLVALKVIRKERLSSPEVVRRFRREVQAAARLSHPNVVLVFDSDHEGDTHFLVMEYVPGITLQRLVEQCGGLPVPQACDYVRQVALGLQHAHEQALVHRDIKPANLMVTASAPGQPGALAYRGAVVKVLDMGVARLYALSTSQEELLSTLTQDGAMLGTPDYIAPEQLENAHEADIRADLYSLGCTFHFLLTGQVPFPGGTLIQKLDKQRWATPPPVDQLRAEVPAGVAAVVRRLMAKKPAERYQTPAELVTALDQLARGGAIPAEPRPPVLAPARQLAGHADAVWGVAVSADGRLALSGGRDRTVRLWDLAIGQEVRALVGQGQEVRAVALSPDGRRALSASGATLRLWDLATGQEVGRLVGHTDAVKSVAFAPDGRRAVSGGDDKAVRLWDVAGRRPVRRLAGHSRDITSVVVTPDGRHALSGSRDQTLRLWDLQTGGEVRRFGGRGMVLSVAVSADGRSAVSGSYDTTLRLWDLGSGQELRRYAGHRQMVGAVAFAPDGRRVLSGSHDRTVRLWDVESTRELCVGEGHAGWVTAVAFTPDGRRAVSAGADGALCLWELPE